MIVGQAKANLQGVTLSYYLRAGFCPSTFQPPGLFTSSELKLQLFTKYLKIQLFTEHLKLQLLQQQVILTTS